MPVMWSATLALLSSSSSTALFDGTRGLESALRQVGRDLFGFAPDSRDLDHGAVGAGALPGLPGAFALDNDLDIPSVEGLRQELCLLSRPPLSKSFDAGKSPSARPRPNRRYSSRALLPEPRPPMKAVYPALKVNVSGSIPVSFDRTRNSTILSAGIEGATWEILASSARNACRSASVLNSPILIQQSWAPSRSHVARLLSPVAINARRRCPHSRTSPLAFWSVPSSSSEWWDSK